MALEISPSVAKELDSSVKTALGAMDGSQQGTFEEEYKGRRRKSYPHVNSVDYFPNPFLF